MRVLLAHPTLVSCECCAAYAFKKPGGEVMRDAAGEPCPRGHGAATPCGSCPKVPKWAKRTGMDWPDLRDRAAELTPRNRAALAAYRRFKAVGRFPEDELVEWYAGVIRQAEEEDAAARSDRTADVTVTFLGLLPDLLKLRAK